ncbi:MAG: type II toxin-antitoxin system mRNA interferase toxin, RelE/StbE family [Patescibacteria group bacterium]
MLTIQYSPAFAKMYRRLPLEVQKIAEKKEPIFRRDPFDRRLKTHKLQGRLNGYWAFSITYRYRIIFSFDNDIGVRFHAIGTHSIYQ